MADPYEALFAELDRRYNLHLIPRVRVGKVTAAESVFRYSILLPGETVARDDVPCTSAVVPQVGQLVRVELVADQPVIVDVVVHNALVGSATITGTATATSTTFADPATGGAGPAFTMPLVNGQLCVVTVFARIHNSVGGSGHQAAMSFSVDAPSGTITAVDADAIESQNTLAGPGQKSTVFAAAETGDFTFRVKYKTFLGGETATFAGRRLVVDAR